MLARRQVQLPPVEQETTAADVACQHAREKLEQTLRQQPEVDRAVEITRRLRQRNGFADQIEAAMRRRGWSP